ncbi:MAG: hypothetical protein KAT48_12160, partial [Bacteroidales bacterium]|nr:hypothetical protein [Bacteroidales bacterium]
MKKLILVFISILLIIGCSDQQRKNENNNFKKLGLKGNIKSCVESKYSAVFKSGKIKRGKGGPIHLYSFDEKGNLIEESDFRLLFLMAGFPEKSTYTFDDNGNRIEKVMYYMDGSIRTTYKYDDYGIMIEEIRYDSFGGINWMSPDKYNNNGDKIEEIRYDSDGSIAWKQTFKYDNDG